MLTCPHNFSASLADDENFDTPSTPALAHALRHYFGLDGQHEAMPDAMPSTSRVAKFVQAGWVDAAFVAPWWDDAKRLARWARTGAPRPRPRA